MYTFQKINEEEYEIEHEGFIQDHKNTWKYRRKNPIHTDQKNSHNEFMYKNSLVGDSVYFGEVIGSIIAQKTIENGCDAELAKKSRNYNGIYDNGVISYYYLAEGDIQISSFYITHQYFLHENIKDYGVPRINEYISALKLLVFTQNRPLSEFEALKQQYIDMVIFDCRYGNMDRPRENWMLYKDAKSGEIKIYPMFDNEAVLGFDEIISGEITPEEVLQYCQNMRMSHIAPSESKRELSRLEDILKYLYISYPEETKKALEKVNRFTLEDLSQLLEEFPDLAEERKSFAKQVFIARGLLMERYIAEVQKEQTNNDMIKTIND